MPSKKDDRRTISVAGLTRVEGEGSLHLTVEGGKVVEVRLGIYEPPRFFEGFLRGRNAADAPDITARICGICPVAYQMSAVHAIERAYGVTVHPMIRRLRRLLYCGEWIESHALHIHMLAAPDFLGCESVVTLAEKEPEAVHRGLRLKKAGNAIIAALGGRAVHPVGVRLGGFWRVPSRTELAPLREELARRFDDAVACVRWVAGLDLLEHPGPTEFVALRHPDEYPMNEGRIVSTVGLDCAQDEFERHFEEYQVPYSTALQARIRERGAYFVGPLARVNLNFDQLGPTVTGIARETGITWPSTNRYASIVARALEVLYSVEEALRLIDGYEAPPAAATPILPRASSGAAITEAPRGMLYQSYELDEAGLIRAARIVPPTSQNQAQIEADLRELAEAILQRTPAAATRLCEMAIRNYDPCISCATHFLRLHVEYR